ncbi:MAG TPA: AraC family transcriptional regulator [Pyrinomonadaceae bacterium]|jgi:AraC family transcriptional regulator
MTTANRDAARLKAGEHYGAVFNKCRIPSAIVSESVYEKKTPLPEHSHELAFFTLILAGNYSEKFAGKSFEYSPLTVLWRQADISHQDRIESNSSRFFFVELEKTSLGNLVRDEKLPEHLFEQNGSLTWLASRLRQEIRDARDFSPLIAEGITLEMLGQLIRKNKLPEKRAPRWLVRVVEKLNEEYNENFSTEVLAAEAGVHPVHLAAVFRQVYKETMGEYVQKLRIAHASRLLLDKEIPLSEIAYATGFSDQSHFTRIFKRLVGITPGAFRSSLD